MDMWAFGVLVSVRCGGTSSRVRYLPLMIDVVRSCRHTSRSLECIPSTRMGTDPTPRSCGRSRKGRTTVRICTVSRPVRVEEESLMVMLDLVYEEQ